MKRKRSNFSLPMKLHFLKSFFAGKGGVGPGGIAAIVIGVLAAIILIVIIVILVLQRRNGATPLIAKFPSFANPAYSRNTDTVEMSQGSNFENPMFGKQN